MSQIQLQRCDGHIASAYVPLTQVDAALRPVTAALPTSTSYLEVRGAVVVTSVRQAAFGTAAPGLEVRLFNPNTEATTASVDFAEAVLQTWRPTAVVPVDLEGNPQGEVQALARPGLDLSVAPKQIVTLRFLA